MQAKERSLYPGLASYLAVPQPFIKRIPFLTTNQEIRLGLVLCQVEGKLLDIGCAENKLVARYREKGGQGLGVDVHPWPGADQVVADTSKLSFADQSFDTITLVACLNHIPNREDVLKEAARLLSDQGRLILTNLTPFISRVWHAFAFWDADQNDRGMKPGEVWGFTNSELKSLLKNSGFKIELKKPFSWGLNQLYVCKKI
jgi:SAM-dependent methyltransferase